MNNYPLILTIFRLLLGIIFLASFIGKVNEPRRFASTLVAFKLIPNTWVQPLAVILIITESIIATLLIIGWQSREAAFVSAVLLVIFTVAIGLSLLRGYTDLECGCFGARHAQKVNLNLIGRNILLLMTALCIMLWGGGVLALDNNLLVWKRLYIAEMFLPIVLVCVGTLILIPLIRQLYRLLMLIPVED